MAKFFAVTIFVIALASAYPIVANSWFTRAPQDISTHGYLIDNQMHETMIEAGLAFLASQILLAWFIWSFSNRPKGAKIGTFPGGAKTMVLAGFLLVGTEVLALGVFGTKAWAAVYFQPPAADALPIQVQAGQFAFYFRYPGPDGKFGPLHPELVERRHPKLSSALTPRMIRPRRMTSSTAEMAIPVNKEIHLLMHSKDLGHSFFVPELRVHQDFVPGLDLSLHFTATKIGKYEIVCTQLCGLGHYNMKAYLEVMSQSDYDNWLKQEAALQ